MKNGTLTAQKQKPETTEAKKYFIIIAFGLLSAIVIQNRVGFEPCVGSFLIASLLLVILYKDILRYKPQYMKKQSMLVLLGIMIVSTILLGRLAYFILLNLAKGIGTLSTDAVVFGVPIPAGAMLIALLFDFHTAIFFSFIVSLLSGLWLNDAVFPIYAFIGSLTAAFSVIRCKKRTALIKGGLYVIIANLVTTIILLLFLGELFTMKAVSALIFAASSGLIVTATVSLILPILEYIFNISTDISLLELLDLNQPLMKNLMISAPGTYHHSVIVGNLVESAAEAIGVNPLLARVSAYYHDIGKTKMPEYFVENQSAGISKHEKLTPHLSSMIIMSHVKEGVDLAIQHKLPQAITDIIQQHHGTCLITFFYHKAKDIDISSQPPEEEYRYHGPKPQTRIAALVMMADAVEAASRVLSDPTPTRISSLIDRIINHIFLEGQLDECELTLKDIYEIKKHFSYILTGILHRRIEYPGFDFGDENKKTSSKETERGISDHQYESPYKEPPKTEKDRHAEAEKRLSLPAQSLQSQQN